MKKVISRLTTMLMAVFTMAIIAALPITAFAAENEAAVTAVVEEAPIYEENEENVIIVQPMINNYEEPVIQQLGNPQGGGQPGGSKSGSSTADSAYENTMDFIITWIRRLGAAVALFGGIMLGLALKNNEADQKENGIKTMIAGFVVFAICGAVDMFDLFS
ncbi:hypothetical protein [Ruminococcus sp.]|uniref:hypothetical protein n=1 Tax=Ruminococcus sp. TaxID=41978 RepID=UPI0025FDABBE|nr:hypothetical protein [Ruminococcus sp.]MBR1432678.1 hypothetical protein [Ruminococcus sp.]